MLTAVDGVVGDAFGFAVALSGDRALVGVPFDDDKGENSGSAYVYEWGGSSWVEVAKLTASNGAEGDYFGRSVSISGNWAFVGAPFDDNNGQSSGSVYVYGWDGSSWVEVAKLTASDGAAGDQFGFAIALEGDRALIGAYGNDQTGAVYVYEWNGSSWVEQTKLTASDGAFLDSFGYSVAIAGDRALVGAYRADNSGAAYVYEWDGSSWMEVAKLTASDRSQNDDFGAAVSLSGDRALIGARDDGPGSVYVYEWDGSSWGEMARLTASDGAAGDQFGFAVALDGNWALIGALNDDDKGSNSGSAYVFVSDQAELTDLALRKEADNLFPRVGEAVTFSVTLTNNGPRRASGIVVADQLPATFSFVSASPSQGVYDAATGTWNVGALASGEAATLALTARARITATMTGTGKVTNVAVITASDQLDPVPQNNRDSTTVTPVQPWKAIERLNSDLEFGASIALSGDWIVAGAPRHVSEAGAVLIYQWNGSSWVEAAMLMAPDWQLRLTDDERFGHAVSIKGDRVLIGAPAGGFYSANPGSAYVYEWDGSSWVEVAKLTASDGAIEDRFGSSVSLSGNRALVGAPLADDRGENSGAAYVYEWDGSSWVEVAKLTASDGAIEDRFGSSVSLSGNRALVGAPFVDDKSKNSGAAYVYEWDGSSWAEVAKLVIPDYMVDDKTNPEIYFGGSVSINGNQVVIGAPREKYEGAAYVYEWDGSSWVEAAWLKPFQILYDDNFGVSVALDGDRAAVIATLSDRVEVFERDVQENIERVWDGTIVRQDEGAGIIPLRVSFGLGSVQLVNYNNLVLRDLLLEGSSLVGKRGEEDAPASEGQFVCTVSISDGCLKFEWTGASAEAPVSVELVVHAPAQDTSSATLRITDMAGRTLRAELVLDLYDTSVSTETQQTPGDYVLWPGYPNPFRTQTHFRFALLQAAEVRLTVYDILGREVVRLARGFYPAGTHVVTWDGRNAFGMRMPSGVYLYRLDAGPFSQTRKVTLLR